jgi:hypothetical protein
MGWPAKLVGCRAHCSVKKFCRSPHDGLKQRSSFREVETIWLAARVHSSYHYLALYVYELTEAGGMLDGMFDSGAQFPVINTRDSWALICKSLRSPGIDSRKIDSAILCSQAGRYDSPICRTGQPDYIGWWNRFLGIYIPGLLNVYKFRLQSAGFK